MFCLRKGTKSSKDYRLPTSCSVNSLDECLTDSNASFLRAARAGNLEKVLEFLKGNIDINTSNANGLNALHLASKEGHVNVVTELLKRGANVNAATKKGNTALHIASLAGQYEVVKVLVNLGANVNVQSQNGFTPLYMAAQENHDNVVSFLLANGANQSLATEDGFTPLAVALQQGHDKVVAVLLENDTKGKVRLPALHIAAKKDDCKAATLLLQNDHNPDVTSKSGFTPLHIAAHYGNENIANILLEKGADVNFAAKHQITPLHVASKWGKSNMVTLLIDKGANIEASTRDGLTPLHCAARSGHDQVVDLLLERGAPILAKTKNGLAPLHMASQGDHVDSARILLYHKAPVDDVTVDYLTALHVAAHCGHVKVAKLLLDRKADPNARALNGFTPLHIACKKNRIKVVELLLKHGASIEATTESGLTPLHVASFMGCMNIVIYLIQNGANPDVPTVRGETPLHLAARANQTDIIRILLRNDANVDARAREEQTPLHIAARLGNVDIVSLLLQHGAAVDATTKDMYTALHIAAKEDQEEVASVLLDHGASLTSTTKKGFTPLHLAAKYGNIKVARLLLQKDAPVDAQGKNGVTPLHVASHYDHVNVALLLLDKGASPHATAKNGYTPLHIAAKKNQMDIATTLLEYGAKANSESKAGFTPLHLASQDGHTDMTTLLIEHQADVNFKANNGLTPLHLCSQEDRVNVATVLVKNGAEIGPQTKAGYTPLHVASHFGQLNMVRFLLQQNADVHMTTSHGYTPLHQAAQQGHTVVVNLLLENQASPNVTTLQGQTALSIAQRLGYISVVETLKVVTETTVTTTTTTVTEEKYKVVAPETMQETFMTDSEDEGGGDFDDAAFFGKPTHATHIYLPYVEGQTLIMSEDVMLGDQSYRYLTADEMKSLGDDSLPIDVTKDEKQHESVHLVKESSAPMVEEDHISPQHITPVEVGFSEKYSPDNVDLSRAPVHAGHFRDFDWDDTGYFSIPSQGMLRSSRLKWKTFLVSFMVDARGGAMRGCRHSGVRVIIPPRKASMPMRITCRYLRKEKLIHPPPLMEGEACASRILEVGPVGARFLGPVIIEVPHFASLRGKEREITILRSDTGETWREHTLEASEEAVQEVLNESFEGDELSALEDLNTNRITRILTTDFPQYFAIVTRIRQEVHGVGPEGGMVSSTVVPQVQAIFPEGALTKKIRVGLQAQPIAPELVAKLLGNRVAVSPIVTVEPRRRKFHKAITLTIPVPQAATKGMINQYSGDTPTLRLLCSITGGSSKAQWEDVTGSTPLTFVTDCVSFTTTVSARFWLMDCRQVNEASKFATELYQEAVHVPFMSKFVIFAKRNEPNEAHLRVFCMTDDKEDKTLETQENFTEIAKSRDVEVLEGKLQYLEFAGNLVPVTKSGEQLKLAFQAFHENRLAFAIRVKDPHVEPMGRIAFMKEPKVGRGEPPQVPICNLNVALPEVVLSDSVPASLELVTLEKRDDFIQESGLSKPESIHRADLRLSDIARELDKDWVGLAQQLEISESDINLAKSEFPEDVSEQALTMLRLWLQKAGSRATGNELEKALRKINREDIIKKCMFNVELVTDDVEKAVAKVHLDQSGFDVFKEELGSSREASMRRGASLDISYDEQDIMKDAESAAETSSETGSIFERDQISQVFSDEKDAFPILHDAKPITVVLTKNEETAPYSDSEIVESHINDGDGTEFAVFHDAAPEVHIIHESDESNDDFESIRDTANWIQDDNIVTCVTQEQSANECFSPSPSNISSSDVGTLSCSDRFNTSKYETDQHDSLELIETDILLKEEYKSFHEPHIGDHVQLLNNNNLNNMKAQMDDLKETESYFSNDDSNYSSHNEFVDNEHLSPLDTSFETPCYVIPNSQYEEIEKADDIGPTKLPFEEFTDKIAAEIIEMASGVKIEEDLKKDDDPSIHNRVEIFESLEHSKVDDVHVSHVPQESLKEETQNSTRNAAENVLIEKDFMSSDVYVNESQVCEDAPTLDVQSQSNVTEHSQHNSDEELIETFNAPSICATNFMTNGADLTDNIKNETSVSDTFIECKDTSEKIVDHVLLPDSINPETHVISHKVEVDSSYSHSSDSNNSPVILSENAVFCTSTDDFDTSEMLSPVPDIPESEDRFIEEARIRRVSKTPPPSPAEVIFKEFVEEKSTAEEIVLVENELLEKADVVAEEEVPTAVPKPTETVDEIMKLLIEVPEITAKQTESETWPSGEMDTSQVSVSSLPDDEKSETTTATVSSATAADVETETKVEETKEWTETDDSGAIKHVIQKTTHMTLSMQQKSDEMPDEEVPMKDTSTEPQVTEEQGCSLGTGLPTEEKSSIRTEEVLRYDGAFDQSGVKKNLDHDSIKLDSSEPVKSGDVNFQETSGDSTNLGSGYLQLDQEHSPKQKETLIFDSVTRDLPSYLSPFGMEDKIQATAEKFQSEQTCLKASREEPLITNEEVDQEMGKYKTPKHLVELDMELEHHFSDFTKENIPQQGTELMHQYNIRDVKLGKSDKTDASDQESVLPTDLEHQYRLEGISEQEIGSFIELSHDYPLEVPGQRKTPDVDVCKMIAEDAAELADQFPSENSEHEEIGKIKVKLSFEPDQELKYPSTFKDSGLDASCKTIIHEPETEHITDTGCHNVIEGLNQKETCKTDFPEASEVHYTVESPECSELSKTTVPKSGTELAEELEPEFFIKDLANNEIDEQNIPVKGAEPILKSEYSNFGKTDLDANSKLLEDIEKQEHHETSESSFPENRIDPHEKLDSQNTVKISEFIEISEPRLLEQSTKEITEPSYLNNFQNLEFDSVDVSSGSASFSDFSVEKQEKMLHYKPCDTLMQTVVDSSVSGDVEKHLLGETEEQPEIAACYFEVFNSPFVSNVGYISTHPPNYIRELEFLESGPIQSELDTDQNKLIFEQLSLKHKVTEEQCPDLTPADKFEFPPTTRSTDDSTIFYSSTAEQDIKDSGITASPKVPSDFNHSSFNMESLDQNLVPCHNKEYRDVQQMESLPKSSDVQNAYTKNLDENLELYHSYDKSQEVTEKCAEPAITCIQANLERLHTMIQSDGHVTAPELPEESFVKESKLSSEQINFSPEQQQLSHVPLAPSMHFHSQEIKELPGRVSHITEYKENQDNTWEIPEDLELCSELPQDTMVEEHAAPDLLKPASEVLNAEVALHFHGIKEEPTNIYDTQVESSEVKEGPTEETVITQTVTETVSGPDTTDTLVQRSITTVRASTIVRTSVEDTSSEPAQITECHSEKFVPLAFVNTAFVGADLIDAAEEAELSRSRSPYEVLREELVDDVCNQLDGKGGKDSKNAAQYTEISEEDVFIPESKEYSGSEKIYDGTGQVRQILKSEGRRRPILQQIPSEISEEDLVEREISSPVSKAELSPEPPCELDLVDGGDKFASKVSDFPQVPSEKCLQDSHDFTSQTQPSEVVETIEETFSDETGIQTVKKTVATKTVITSQFSSSPSDAVKSQLSSEYKEVSGEVSTTKIQEIKILKEDTASHGSTYKTHGVDTSTCEPEIAELTSPESDTGVPTSPFECASEMDLSEYDHKSGEAKDVILDSKQLSKTEEHKDSLLTSTATLTQSFSDTLNVSMAKITDSIADYTLDEKKSVPESDFSVDDSFSDIESISHTSPKKYKICDTKADIYELTGQESIPPQINGPVQVEYKPEYDDEEYKIEELQIICGVHKGEILETVSKGEVSNEDEFLGAVGGIEDLGFASVETVSAPSAAHQRSGELLVGAEAGKPYYYGSVSDDNVDAEIGKILSSKTEAEEDIIERPRTPEPPEEVHLPEEVDDSIPSTETEVFYADHPVEKTKRTIEGVLDIDVTTNSLKFQLTSATSHSEWETSECVAISKEHIDQMAVEEPSFESSMQLPIELSGPTSGTAPDADSTLSPSITQSSCISEDSSGFVYGMQFEKESEEQGEEAMDIDSDQCSDEKDSSYTYGMRFEREHELDDEDDDIPVYGDLYTHQEEDEDVIDEGEKVKMQFSSSRPLTYEKPNYSDYDTLAGRKFFGKTNELDDISMSSLQEFEKLEEEIVSGRKSSIGSVESFNGKQVHSKSGEHDDVSMNSLTEFEKLERECAEAERAETISQEVSARLSEIEEGHESQSSEASQETISDAAREDDSDVSDFDDRLNKIDKIIKEAQTNVEIFGDKSAVSILSQNTDQKSDVFSDDSLSISAAASLKKTEQVMETVGQKFIESSSGDLNAEQKYSPEFIYEHIDSPGIVSTTIMQEVRSVDGTVSKITTVTEKKQMTKFSDSVSEDKDIISSSEYAFNMHKKDDMDQDSLHEDKSIKPDSLCGEEKYEYQDSLHEDKSADIDSLQEEVPDIMKDSLHEERPLDEDSLHEMDILPDESSLSLESNLPATTGLCQDPGKSDDAYAHHIQTHEHDVDTDSWKDLNVGGDTLESAFATHVREVALADSGRAGDIMISSTDSLERSSSAATHATYQFETESIMSSSINSVQTSDDCTMVSSTDTMDPDVKISYGFSGTSMSDIHFLTKDGQQKVFIDSEGNIQTQQDLKVFTDMEGNIQNTVLIPTDSDERVTSKFAFSEPADYHTCTTTVTYNADTKQIQQSTPFLRHQSEDTDDSQSEYTDKSSGQFDPEVEIEEIQTLDEKGNPVTIRRIRRVVETKSQTFTTSSTSDDIEEKFKQFLKDHASGSDAGKGEEEFEEERRIDEKGNVVIVRTVKQQILSEPQVYSKSFSGPNADELSSNFIKSFQTMDPTETTEQYEKVDNDGNIVRVTQQVIMKPEMHTLTFSGPDAHKQMEEYMKQWTASQDDSRSKDSTHTESSPCSSKVTDVSQLHYISYQSAMAPHDSFGSQISSGETSESQHVETVTDTQPDGVTTRRIVTTTTIHHTPEDDKAFSSFPAVSGETTDSCQGAQDDSYHLSSEHPSFHVDDH